MITKTCIAIALLSTISGCGFRHSDHFNIDIDPAFDASKQTMIIEAVGIWQTALGDRVSFDVSIQDCEKTGDTMCIHADTIAEVIAISGLSRTVGFTDWTNNDSDIYLPTDSKAENANDTNWLQDCQHEMGHAMGLFHSQEGSLMYYLQNNAALQPTCVDINQYAQARGQYQVACGQDVILTGQ